MNWKWGLFAVLVVALALRLLGLRYGLPYVYNPDEVAIMSRALAFAKGDLNPHNFLYPTLYFYVLFAWEGLTALLAVATRAVASFADFQRGFFLDPTRVYVAGRLLTALLGTATVAATWALARRMAGSIAAPAAALVVAVSPLHVRDSHYVKHDVPVTLLIVLAYLAYDRLWNKEGSLVLAAVVTGLAFSTHYYTIFLSIPLAWSAAHTARDRGDAMKRVLLAGAISAVVFFVCSPFILAEPHTALRDVHANRQIVVDRAVASLGYAATLVRYGVMLFRDTVGRPLAIFVAVGILVGAIREREKTRLLLAFCVPFFLFIATTYPASRYLIPLVPFGAIFAGFAVAWWAESTRRHDRLGLVVVFGLGVLLAFGESLQVDLFIRQTDTRTLAAEVHRLARAGGIDGADSAIFGAHRADGGRPPGGRRSKRAGHANENAPADRAQPVSVARVSCALPRARARCGQDLRAVRRARRGLGPEPSSRGTRGVRRPETVQWRRPEHVALVRSPGP